MNSLNPDDSYDVFLSHSSRDKKKIARPLYKRLKSRGIHTWYDEAEILEGRGLSLQVKNGLNKSKMGVIVITENSKNSQWVIEELAYFEAKFHLGMSDLFVISYGLQPQTALDYSKLFNDYFYFSMDGNYRIAKVANKIEERLSAFNTQIGDALERSKAKRRKENIRKSMAILFAILCITIGLSFFSNSSNVNLLAPEEIITPKESDIIPFDTSRGSYNVLLLPFQPMGLCEHKRTGIEKEIEDRLNTLNKLDALNIEVQYDSINCADTYDQVYSLGRRKGADLIIWGDIDPIARPAEACLRYIKISNDIIPGDFSEGESMKEQLFSLFEIKEGKLQMDIDYIIYWTSAYRNLARKKYDKALNQFWAIENSGYYVSADLYNSMFMCYMNLNKIDSAELFIKKALELDSNNSAANNNYSSILKRKKRVNDASIYMRKSILLDSSNIIARRNYGTLLLELKDTLKAVEQFYAALALNPKDTSLAGYIITLRLRYIGNYLNRDPKCEDANIDFAVLSFQFNNFLDAVGDLNYVVKTNPLQEAEWHFQYALKNNPKSARAHYEYSLFLAYTKNYDSSREHYLQAVKINPSLRTFANGGNYFGIE